MIKPLVKILLIMFSLGSYLINAYAVPLKEKKDSSHSDEFSLKRDLKIEKIKVTNDKFEQTVNSQIEEDFDSTPSSKWDNIRAGAQAIGAPLLLSLLGGLIGAIIFELH